MTSYEFFCSLEDYSLSDCMTCFVEEFKNYRHSARKLVLRDEPMRLRGTQQERAFYAALCEFYANWYHLHLPPWLEKEEYFLKEKWYPFSTDLIESKSPIEFRRRNIIIGPNDVVLC